MRQDEGSWLGILFLRCTEEHRYIACVTVIAARYVEVSSSNLTAASLDFAAFDKPFDRLYLYSNLDYCLKETIFERRLISRDDSCGFINWNCPDVYAIYPLVSSGLSVLVPHLWLSYECSRILFLPMPIIMAYYSIFGDKSAGTGADFCIAISQICFCAPVLFLFSALAGGTLGYSSRFVSVEDVSARGVLLALSDSFCRFGPSVGLFWILSGCTVNSVKNFLVHRRFSETVWLHEG